KLIKITRKAPILKQPAFGCLRDVPSINITKSCMHSCVYCYARGFTDAPPKGEVFIYEGIHKILEGELGRKRRLPLWVSFSTASDAFQDIDEVLKESYLCMKLLLERGIGISFLTKGAIPWDFIELFKSYPGKVKARIGLVSVDEGFRRLFEPHSATINQRLMNIKNLLQAGIETSVRIDPVIPVVTDSEAAIEALIKRCNLTGVKELAVSCLVMRPSIMEFLSEIPDRLRWRILKLYRGQPWQRVITSAKTRLLPIGLRKRIYQRFSAIAQRYGIRTKVCGCKNPDMPWEFCSPWVDGEKINRQMELFG
ncbi:MAG: radical SAM protein, partial [Thermodesulfovibrionales bacterium]